MASHESSRSSSASNPSASPAELLARRVPIDASAAHTVSWELGDRLVADADVARTTALANRRSGSALDVFDVTANTCLLRYRTPVGRELYYEAAKADVEDGLRRLDRSAVWRPSGEV